MSSQAYGRPWRWAKSGTPLRSEIYPGIAYRGVTHLGYHSIHTTSRNTTHLESLTRGRMVDPIRVSMRLGEQSENEILFFMNHRIPGLVHPLVEKSLLQRLFGTECSPLYIHCSIRILLLIHLKIDAQVTNATVVNAFVLANVWVDCQLASGRQSLSDFQNSTVSMHSFERKTFQWLDCFGPQSRAVSRRSKLGVSISQRKRWRCGGSSAHVVLWLETSCDLPLHGDLTVLFTGD